ncbi:MAG: hypothetical protein KZQ85_11920 [Candidatus Thiodiazotropha sp. (ex Myrtea sp. 'scaly one' KF741663)]|nr:hypothetical protein [Candidatus Thiodiazotropha sp. (ex Myrtea sp. 'scaly one' KF741663)]
MEYEKITLERFSVKNGLITKKKIRAMRDSTIARLQWQVVRRKRKLLNVPQGPVVEAAHLS